MVFMYHYVWKNVGYTFWVVPDRTSVSSKFANTVGVFYYSIAVETYIYCSVGASVIFDR